MDKLLDARHAVDDWEVTLLFKEEDGLEKAAAAQEVIDFSKKIDVDDSKFYLHINAMGAGEYYGSNRNGDFFPEENLLKWYKTFETSPAHVFRHHVNKDPSIAIGKVIYSYYNPRMHRVELIAEVDKVKGAMELAAIEEGNFPMTSMACNTPYDVCSICNNKAHSRAEYCSHLATQLNTILPNGKKVMSLNVGPLKFFDISIVIRPADVTSSVLQKVAGEDIVVGSLEAAEAEDLTYGSEKDSSIRKEAEEKAAELIKQIDGGIVTASPTLTGILESIQDPDVELLTSLKKFSLDEIISTFAYMGINPSLKYLVKILAGKYVGEREDEISSIAMETLAASGPEVVPLDSAGIIPDIDNAEPNEFLVKILTKYMEHSSFHREFVEKRAADLGYANLEPGQSALDDSPIFMSKGVVSPTSQSILRLIGGAIIAKMMIGTLAGSVKSNSGAFMKSAELTSKLMDMSTHNDLEKYKYV